MPTAIPDAFACYSLASSAAYRRHPLPALSVSGSGPSAPSSSKVKRSGRAGWLWPVVGVVGVDAAGLRQAAADRGRDGSGLRTVYPSDLSQREAWVSPLVSGPTYPSLAGP